MIKGVMPILQEYDSLVEKIIFAKHFCLYSYQRNALLFTLFSQKNGTNDFKISTFLIFLLRLKNICYIISITVRT